MIAYCRTCKDDTIVRPRVGAKCSWCETSIVTTCPICNGPVYRKRRGRPATRCAICRKQRRSLHESY